LPPEFPAGDRFELDSCLGKGGYGVVYRARDRQRHTDVALKLLARPNVADLYLFKQEFRALSDLSHPHLVSLYELLFQDGRWFIVMELVDGTDFIRYVSARQQDEPPRADEALAAEETTLVRPESQSQDAGPSADAPRPLILMPADLGRLESCLSQLSRAVDYLHSEGRLHRDIKPSNVLVTADGRVKVLDFGLVVELAPDSIEEGAPILGTPAYMSPEQMRGGPLTQASDWYSVGVMLYRALTGSLPFAGSLFETLRAKQERRAVQPHLAVHGAPLWLSRLAWDLLAPRPGDRPTGEEVLSRLGNQGADSPAGLSIPAPPATLRTLVGRDQQLEALAAAYETTKSGRAVIVHVHGGSGMGKTALVRRFLDELQAASPSMVLLSGRCYERESVPYKALDSVVDRLSRYLKQLPQPEVDALLPRDVRAVARLFPMLGQVAAVVRGSERGVEIKDAQELRRRGFAAFRELIGRLSDRRPVVVFIDDLQWGDADSVVLLTDLMRPPNPPAILLILSYRAEEASSSAALRELPNLRLMSSPDIDVRDLQVGELSRSEARELARALLKGAGALSSALAETIADESQGSPFFLDALVRHVQAFGGLQTIAPQPDTARTPAGGAELTLESVIGERIEDLVPAARRLVEVLAVFGQPLPAALASRAADLAEDELGATAALRAARLVRTRVTDAGEEVELYHDRIRETVAARLSAPVSKAYHARLATVLEDAGWTDPETLATHFSEAGDRQRAAAYAVRAADEAGQTLAFARAARLYRLALELGASATSAVGSRIQMKLGEALAGAGRGYEAAEAYLGAAEGALAADRLELMRRAADQLLRSGYVKDGFAVTQQVLDAIGMRLAATPLRALVRFLLYRAEIRLGGLRFRERDRSQISAEALVRVDACWSVATGLSVVDTIRAAEFQARHLLLALKTGDPLRIARALAAEVPYASLGGPGTRRRTEQLAAVAERVAARVDDPFAAALVALARGTASYFQGAWPTTRELLSRADTILREQCTGVTWELDTAHLYLVLALFYLGEVSELRARVPTLLKEAEERDDLTGTTNLRTRVSYLLSLADDHPERARDDVQQGMARWPRQGFHTQHSWELYACGEIDLYEGRHLAAWDRIEGSWPALRRSFLLRIQNVRIEFRYLRARCALGAAFDAETPVHRRPALRRAARRDVGRLARENAPWAAALADLVAAAADTADGRPGEALRRLQRAESAFMTLHMPLHGAVASRLRGVLTAGDDGRVLVQKADAWMDAQTIRHPARFAAMLAPGPFPAAADGSAARALRSRT
jgi:serine/threonine protein kinase